MKQRLGFARLLLGRPELLVLDEPTNGLDPGEIREIRELIGRLSEQGATVLLSSHHLSEVEQVCSHVLVMNHGRLVADGTVSDLIGIGGLGLRRGRRSRTRRSRVARPSPGVAERADPGRRAGDRAARRPRSDLAAALVGAGLRLETIMPTQRLEDAFLDLLAAGDAARVPRDAGGGGVMIALIRTEFIKAARRTRTLVIALLLVGLPTLIVVAINARGNRAAAATTARACSASPSRAGSSSRPRC